MNTLAHRMDTWHDARRAGRLRRPRRVRERRGSPPVPRPADPRARDRFRDERPRDAFVSLEPPDRLVPARRLRALSRARRELRIPLARPAPGAPPRSVRYRWARKERGDSHGTCTAFGVVSDDPPQGQVPGGFVRGGIARCGCRRAAVRDRVARLSAEPRARGPADADRGGLCRPWV